MASPQTQDQPFETSAELKRLFNDEFERWCKKQRLGMQDLAEKCGVTSSYLSHVGRYGRIPGKPVLILLALNFEMDDPRRLFIAAESKDPWPYDDDIGLAKKESALGGFLSVKLDMKGLVSSIRDVVRSEIKPRSLRELLGYRPLRIGLNLTQRWLFDNQIKPSGAQLKGVFPELCQMLRVSLQCEVETLIVPFAEHVDRLIRGDLDVYGPLMSSPHTPTNLLFSAPLHRIGISAVMRKRTTDGLVGIGSPKTIDDIAFGRYEIAVLKNSRAHLLANTRLKRPDETLILCSSDEEALDRILIKGINKPAHLFLCNSLMAKILSKQHADEVSLLFATEKSLLDMVDNSLAIRPDWPEVVPIINDAIRFLMSSGGFSERFEQWITADFKGLVVPVTYSS